ncbi:MAG: phage major capsid protein, partial [Pseudomonadota bacterium]
MTIKELRAARIKALTDARAVHEKTVTENRDYTVEEQTAYDGHMADHARLSKLIEREDQLAAAERAATEADLALQRAAVREPPTGTTNTDPTHAGAVDAQAKASRAFNRWLRFGEQVLDQEERRMLRPESRALQADSDIYGGYVVAPEQWVNELIKGVDNLVFFRRLARTFRVPTAASLGCPSLDNDVADPTWTTEITVGSEDSTMSLGKRDLHPHPLAQYLKVSNTLLRKGMISVESLVRDRLAYKIAVVEENAFLNGDGVNSPLG